MNAHAGVAAVSRTAIGLLRRPAVIGFSGLSFGAAVPTDWIVNGPPLCLFRALTGLPCPGCGLTRAVVSLLHGDLPASLHFHPLGLLFVLVCLAIIAVDSWTWWQATRSGDGAFQTTSLLERLAQTPAPWVAVIVLTVVWVVRLPLYVAGVWVF